jgi:DNA-binding transcriptional LysR family regulator
MDISQLQSFLEVAARGSFTKAAQALYITQPAVSQHIRALEAHHGVSLFERRGKGVTLTPAGRALQERARDFLDRWREMETLFEDFANLRRGKLVVASTAVIATYVVCPVVAAFMRAYPGVEVTFRHGNTFLVGRMVQDGEADLGFGGDSRLLPRALKSILVHREPLVLVTAPDNPLLAKTRLSVSDLTENIIVWRERGTLVRERLEQYFAGDFAALPRVEVDRVELAKRLAEGDRIIAAVPQVAVRREIESGRLKVLRLTHFNPQVSFNLLYSERRPLGKSAQAFLAFVAAAKVFSETAALEARLLRDGLLPRM